MVGDYFTKPLRGGLFNKFRDRILNTQNDPLTVPIEDHRSVLGRDHSHATGQSHGESQATAQHNQTKGTKIPHQTSVRSGSQLHNKPNVHAVMVPMSQPTGGWHVTSMTGRSRSTLPNPVSHEYRIKHSVNSLFLENLVSVTITATQFIS